MRKVIVFILTAALILSLASAAYAETSMRGQNRVDADNDGVCDVCGSTDADGDGACDDCPYGGQRPMDGVDRRTSRGAGFTDADGDGVCDNGQRAGICGRIGRSGK